MGILRGHIAVQSILEVFELSDFELELEVQEEDGSPWVSSGYTAELTVNDSPITTISWTLQDGSIKMTDTQQNMLSWAQHNADYCVHLTGIGGTKQAWLYGKLRLITKK